MLVHFSIPPSFFVVHPREESQLKPIFVPELVNLYAADLKNTQREIIKLVDTYQAVHYKLLTLAMLSKPKVIPAVEEHIVQLYNSLFDLRTYTTATPINFEWSCKELISKYYREAPKIVFHCLPSPSKLLMSTDLDFILGDFNTTILDKSYTFFMCSPFKFIYLQKRDKNLYYKFVNMYYSEFNPNENESNFMEPLLK
jgi:hypothetical protein